MRITRIEIQKKNPARKNIYADDEFLVGVSAETLIRFGIRTGDEIGEEKLKALQATEELQGAKTVALRFLTRRQRTEKEIRDKLREREFGDEEIRKTIETLQGLGFLNDQEFARSYIRHQLTLRPKGKLLLRQKLLMLGVAKDIVDSALDEAFQETGQEGSALEAAQKFLKKSQKSKDDPRKAKQKLVAFLIRRGFTWDIVSSVTKKIMAPKTPEEEP